MLHHDGRIEVICGSMFCGKTEELLRRIRRATIAKQQVQVFKPRIDDRYSQQNVTSHNGQQFQAIIIDEPHDVFKNLSKDTTVIAIDEVQFLDNRIVHVVETLAEYKIRVILAGLDLDFRGEPFGPIPQLIARAEEVTKLHAICVVCGEEASRTQRLVNNSAANYDDPIILVGATETYEARCRNCHEIPGNPNIMDLTKIEMLVQEK